MRLPQGGLPALVMLGLFVVAPEAGAIIIRHDVPAADYVVSSGDYPAVVTVFPPDDCSATLIHRAHLLTVAHCAVDLEPGDPLDVGGAPSAVAAVTLHPQWSDGDNYDIAVVRLEEAVDHIAPLPLYRGADELGALVTLVGRGTTGTGLEGESGGSNDGVLRRATNIVTRVDALVFAVAFEAPDEEGGTPLEGVGASGDSGGPVFLDVEGTPHIAGLNAFGDAPNGVGIGEYGSTDYQTRVSAFADWVDGVVAAAEELGDTEGTSGEGSESGGDDTGLADETTAADPGEAEPATGCSCRQTDSPLGTLWLVVGVVAVMRRRREGPRTSVNH